MTRILLHVEGFFVFILSVYLYSDSQFSWVLFFTLLLAPDLSMLGYIISSKVGAITYNGFHTYIFPICLILVALLLSEQRVMAIGLIWTTHIGMDRMLGFGLKYGTDFKDTHLHRV